MEKITPSNKDDISKMDMMLNMTSENRWYHMRLVYPYESHGSKIMDLIEEFDCLEFEFVEIEEGYVAFRSRWVMGVGIAQKDDGFKVKVHELPPLRSREMKKFNDHLLECQRAADALTNLARTLAIDRDIKKSHDPIINDYMDREEKNRAKVEMGHNPHPMDLEGSQ